MLRWAEIPPDALATLLATRFAGVGEAANTVLDTPGKAPRREYRTRDTRYLMAMRCFIHDDEIPREKMMRQACHRLMFLAAKLAEGDHFAFTPADVSLAPPMVSWLTLVAAETERGARADRKGSVLAEALMP